MIFSRHKKTERSRQPQLMDGQDGISFRRSRTLQGTTSSNVKAANQKRAELKSDRLKKQDQQQQRRMVTTGLLVVVALVLFAWYLVSQYTVDVGEMTYNPETSTTPNDALYKKSINEYLSIRPAERFRFAINDSALTQFVAASLPEVKKISVDGGQANRTNFKLELRQPIASWKTGDEQSFVDDEGVSLANNYYSNPSVVITDNTGASNSEQPGTAVVSERFLRFLGRLVALTNSSGLGEVSEASLPKNTAREIDIKLKGRPYYIKTHIDRDPAATVEDIKRVVGFLEQKKVTPVYIDVRVNGRAFYK